MQPNQQALLRIRGLSVDFDASGSGTLHALEGVDLDVGEGEIHGLVGESGSGKTVLAHTILGLLPKNGRLVRGSIEFLGRNIAGMPEPELRSIRGKQIAMIFQDPQASLNPIYAVGRQIEWVLKLHRGLTGNDAREEVLRLFESVRLRNPKRVAKAHAHELSGGMAQRVMIAMALACRPKLLIADEPTSALDVTIQAELADLLLQVAKEFGISMLFITHDLGLAAHLCSNVTVMSNGRVVERGATRDVFASPTDPYTKRLLDSLFLPTGIRAGTGSFNKEQQETKNVAVTI